ncbi:putative B3 domain-containing protein [Senna tora]|uniref:Putative B3 domain-containing protein n=1 Tax=Senna tora TaxID=362788 RepID=A0A834XKY1_9FABA|nr:putative B3 domain-containing protein [Senna tora]
MDASSHYVTKLNKPSFLKVMIDDDFSTRLRIPPTFVKKYGKKIPKKAKIEACDGKLWEVEVQKVGGIFSFGEGWGNFVQETKVEFEDLLRFKLLADSSKFKVKIYGKTCCEKELPSEHVHGNVKEKQDQRKRSWVDEVDDDDDEECARRKNCELEKDRDFEEDDVMETDSDSFDDKTGVLEQRRWKERTKAEDEQIKFNSQYPFFQVKLTSSYVNGGYLHIPKNFRKHMMKMRKKEQKVKFQMCNEFCTMGLHFINEDLMREIRISQGWSLFVKKYDLKMADLCIFEMITSDDDDDEVIFIVHVHRWDGGKSEFVKIY